MKKIALLAVSVTLLWSTTACTHQLGRAGVDEIEPQIQFECTHGVSSIDPLKDILIYDGHRVTIDYTFQNGNMDSNFGIMLFLDGDIQPFSIDEAAGSAVMNIVNLKKNENKKITISFNPITGNAGDNIPLHIVALFDAANTPSTGSIGPMFVHMLSQSYPITLNMSVGSSPNDSIDSKKDFLVETIANTEPVKQKAEDEEIKFDFFNATDDSNYLITLPNNNEGTTTYRLYAYANHFPIKMDGELYADITLDKKTVTTISFKVDQEASDEYFLYFIAVPLHTSDIVTHTSILKTRSISKKVN